MITMWTPDGRAVSVPITRIAEFVRMGLSVVEPARTPREAGRLPADTIMSSEGIQFVDPPLPAATLFEHQEVFPGIVFPSLSMPGFNIPRFVDRFIRRDEFEFITDAGDIPTPTGEVDLAAGERVVAPADTLTPFERKERAAFPDEFGRREPPKDQLPTGFGGPVPSRAPGQGWTLESDPAELKVACEGGDYDACFILAILGDEDDAGRGRGGGAIRAPYQPPDVRQVEDQIGAMLTALVGSQNDIQKFVDIYMEADRKRWGGAAEDPGQSVLEAIRDTASYKSIHKNRPDFITEGNWIGRQIANLESQGLRTSDVQQRAIDLATVGTAPTVRDASVAQVQTMGRFTPEFMRRIGDAATTIARTI